MFYNFSKAGNNLLELFNEIEAINDSYDFQYFKKRTIEVIEKNFFQVNSIMNSNMSKHAKMVLLNNILIMDINISANLYYSCIFGQIPYPEFSKTKQFGLLLSHIQNVLQTKYKRALEKINQEG